MFKRILVALKFTPASRSVLEKGIEIARDHGAELHIFHTLDYRLQKKRVRSFILTAHALKHLENRICQKI